MPAKLVGELDAFTEQSAALADWLDGVPDAAFGQPSVLAGWDLRTLVGHVLLIQRGLARVLGLPSADRPLSAATYLRTYAENVDAIAASTAETTGEHSPRELVAALRDVAPVAAAAEGVADRDVLAGPRGPITALDWVITRTLDLVVHCDDLSRSLPGRAPVPLRRRALATAVRSLAAALAESAPGRSVEVRIPPFAAVQAVEGPRHTRGTPPNVVETDPVTWLRLATGRAAFADVLRIGDLRATGPRSDLTDFLPVL